MYPFSKTSLEGRHVQQQECWKRILLQLKACSNTRNLGRGRELHAEAAASGYDSYIYVVNALVNMYAKCGSMAEARKVFDNSQCLNVVTWNTLLLGYAANGEGNTALDLFARMHCQGYAPTGGTYVAALKACTSLALEADANAKAEYLERGKLIHFEVGCHLDIYVQNTLIDMYGKCGHMLDARQVFNSVDQPDVVSWNALMFGYVENGEGITALDLFARMQSRRCTPNPITYIAALKACTQGIDRAECLAHGRRIHLEIGCHMNIYVQNTLIDMYAKCESMVEARQVFEDMKRRSSVSWNALMLGYQENGESLVVLELFARMKSEGFPPDPITYAATIKACSSLAENPERRAECLNLGRQMHSEIGRHSDVYVQTTLVEMYAKCGRMLEARGVFISITNPNVVSWTSIILGYAENGEGHSSLDMFHRMKSQGCEPNSVTFVAVLKACTVLATGLEEDGRAECLDRGRQIHSEVGSHIDSNVESTLINMYSKCGSMVDARRVFDSILNPDVVSWNALLLGYAANGEAVTALKLFAKMKSRACAPNSASLVAALKACSLLGALDSGSKIHAEMEPGIELNAMLLTSLVDFYAKCGNLLGAQKLFDLHPRTRDVTTWTALLAGYCVCGDIDSVFRLVEEMQDDGFQPNDATSLCILTCCSHAGLVVRAQDFFEAMAMKHGVAPSVEHYSCMADILARSNKLNDAMALLRSMHCRPNGVTWMTVLGACRKWKNVWIGRVAFASLVSLDHTNAAAYVLMAHICGSSGMWQEQDMLLSTRNKLRKPSRLSAQSFWICEHAEAHAFVEKSHPSPLV